MPPTHSSDPLLGSPRPNDRPYSPPPTFSSEAEWGSPTDSPMHSEAQSLLRSHTPPPSYDEVDPTYATWHVADEDPSNSSSSPLLGVLKVSTPATQSSPRPLIDFDVEPQHSDERIVGCDLRQDRYQSAQNICLRSSKAARAIVVLVILFMAVIGLCVGRGIVSWMSVCLVKDFVSRDYQIQTLEHFDFSNTNKQNSGLPRGFKGTMHVLPGPYDQSADLNVSIRSTVSDLRRAKSGADWRPSSLARCAQVTLYFRPGLEVASFRISSNKMELVLSSDLTVAGSSTISIRKGSLVVENFNSSRETYIHVEKSSLTGTLALHDVLSIKARKGSVSVDINPKPVLNGLPMPAMLMVDSISGSININYPGYNADIPERDYQTSITSRSGSIGGKYLHGSKTTIDVDTGRFDAQIVPYGNGKGPSTLTTSMESGSGSIELLKPDTQHGFAINRMSSSHSGRKGHLQLTYPDEWQGSIYGEARSGSLALSGPGVKIIDQGNKRRLNYIKAEKGHGTNKMKFDIRDGSVDATFRP